MASYDTKLKLGRKLDNVDTATASDNQISALLRFDPETGEDGHVSLSVESDTMTFDDVAAVFHLLHERGVLSASQTRTWLSQPKASRERFGETTEWRGEDLEKKVSMLKHGVSVRTGGGGGNGPNGPSPQAALRTAIVKVGEVERKVRELRSALQGGGEAEPVASESE